MNLTREQEHGVWQGRINAAMSVIENELAPRWRETMRNWRGEYWLDETDPGHKVSVNMVWAIASLMQAALYFADPRVVVGAKKPNLGRNPQLAEALFNYYLGELDLGAQVKRCIKDAILFDAGYLKVGYEIDLAQELDPIQNEDGEDLYDGDGNQMLSDGQGNLYLNRDGRFIQVMEKDGELVMQEQEQPTINEYVRREQPFAIRWAPWDVLIDPKARYADLSDATWVAFRQIVPLEEVKGNPAYRNTAGLQGGLIARKDLLSGYEMMGVDKTDPDLDCVEIFEIWCKNWNKKKRRYDLYQKVVATGHDKFLQYRLSPHLADGLPVKALVFDEDPSGGLEDKPAETVGRGFSVLRAIDSQIESMNLSRAQMVTMQDQQIQKWVANGQFITQEEMDEFAQNPNGGYVRFQNVPPEVPVGNILAAIPIPQIPPDIRISYDLARDEIQVVAGFSDYQFGGSGGPKRQATEAGLIQSGFSIRVEEKRQAVGKLIEQTVRYWAMLLRQHGDYETWVKVTGDGGEQEFISFKIADTITDELEFSIDTFQSVFQAREVQQKAALDRFNLMANSPLVNPVKLLEDVFRSYGIQDITPYLAQQQPMMDPMAAGMGADASGLKSIAAGNQAVDVNMMRAPAAVGAGATGRAIG